jgi:hypothetical protein
MPEGPLPPFFQPPDGFQVDPHDLADFTPGAQLVAFRLFSDAVAQLKLPAVTRGQGCHRLDQALERNPLQIECLLPG